MDNASLAACILINQRERNQAIGVSQDTQLLRGLSTHVLATRQDQAKDMIELVVRATWLRAMIGELTALADRLVDHITENIEDDDTRSDGLHTMVKLDALISHLGDELEAIL